jgi:hypothetical protein
MRKEKVAKYNVWIHIEGVNKDGDCIEGDEYYEPLKAGSFKNLAAATALQEHIICFSESWEGRE